MLLTLVVTLFLAVISYAVRRDILFPGFIVSTLWFFVSFAHSFQDTVGPIGSSTQMLIAIGTLCFTIGSMLPIGSANPRVENSFDMKGIPGVWIQAMVVSVSGLIVLWMLSLAVSMATSGPSENLLINLKLEISYGDGYGALRYGVPITFIAAYIGVVRLISGGGVAASILSFSGIALGVIAALLTTGRGVMLQGFLFILVPLICFGKIRPWVILISGFGFLGVFLAFGASLGKVDGVDAGTPGGIDISLVMRMLELYLVGGTGALNHFVEIGSPLDAGTNTFRGLLAALHSIGLGSPPKELIEEFIYVPAPTNVYSYYYPYFADFGFIFAVFMQIPIGLLYGLLYVLVRKHNTSAIGVFFFSALIYPLVMQFQQDYLFVSLSLWVQFLLWAILIFLIPSLLSRTSALVGHRARANNLPLGRNAHA